MPSETEVVVIGAGQSGLAATRARTAAARGQLPQPPPTPCGVDRDAEHVITPLAAHVHDAPAAIGL